MSTLEQIRQEAPLLVARAMRAGLIRLPAPEELPPPKRTSTSAREERIASGLCGLGCGRPLTASRWTCEPCKEKEAERKRKKKEGGK